MKCYNCGKRGHISTHCPEKANYFGGDGKGKSVRRRGLVVEVGNILLDTRCTQTMVRSDLVDSSKLIAGEATTIRCVHGDNALYPLAEVEVNVDGVAMTVRAAISEELPVAVLLGTDVPELGRLLSGNILARHTSNIEQALVTTRMRA